jgi:uncharacterized protein DUF6174
MMTSRTRYASSACGSWRVRLTRLTAGAALASSAACGLVTGTDDNDDEEALRGAQVRWNNARVQDYTVVVQHLCFCGYVRPVRITVRSGAVVSSVDAQTGEPVPTYATVRDIAALFTLIRQAIDDGADKLDVTYDSQLGYPTFINIDYITNAVDDELQVRTSEFQQLR